MNRKHILLMFMVVLASLMLAACATGEEAPATRVPTTAPTEAVVATEEVVVTEEAVATEEVVETEEAVATEEVVVTEEAVETEEAVATEEVVATEEAVEVGGRDVATTEEAAATEEVVVTEEATEEPTEEVVVTEEATEEPTEEVVVTEEATEEPTEEVVVTEEAVETEEVVVTEEATEEPTEEVVVTEEAVETEEAVATEEVVVTEEAVATEEVEVEATEEATETEGFVNLAGSITAVCLVSDIGRINDGTFNQSAYNGMVRAAAEFNLDYNYIETQNPADYSRNIDTCISDGAQAVITVGFLITDATAAAATANPDVYFIGVDQFHGEAQANLVGIQFREDQASFLAGAMAALVTESNVIGGVYGEEIPPVIKLHHGFEAGARYINPEIEILGVYVGSFTAPAEGGEAAENFIGEGADVIFGAGGATGSGGILAAAAQGVKVVGVDQDEYYTSFGSGSTPGAEFLITSAIKKVDEGVYQMLNALTAGEYGWPTSSLYLMDASVDGVGFAPANDAVIAEEITAKVQEIFELLKSGELETGIDPVTGAYLEVEAEDAE